MYLVQTTAVIHQIPWNRLPTCTKAIAPASNSAVRSSSNRRCSCGGRHEYVLPRRIDRSHFEPTIQASHAACKDKGSVTRSLHPRWVFSTKSFSDKILDLTADWGGVFKTQKKKIEPDTYEPGMFLCIQVYECVQSTRYQVSGMRAKGRYYFEVRNGAIYRTWYQVPSISWQYSIYGVLYLCLN